jgi:predicted PilT family ATPase
MARQLSAIRPDGVEIDANAFHAQDELDRVLIPRPPVASTPRLPRVNAARRSTSNPAWSVRNGFRRRRLFPMRSGILLYGPPAAGKDTITTALAALDARYAPFRRLKVGAVG